MVLEAPVIVVTVKKVSVVLTGNVVAPLLPPCGPAVVPCDAWDAPVGVAAAASELEREAAEAELDK